MLKRYDAYKGCNVSLHTVMVLDEDGAWVRYEDVVPLLAVAPVQQAANGPSASPFGCRQCAHKRRGCSQGTTWCICNRRRA
jgi:hypothetical protein